MKQRHKWGQTEGDVYYKSTCQKCGCIRKRFHGGRATYFTQNGERLWNITPSCVPDTPLLQAVRAYIKLELSQ